MVKMIIYGDKKTPCTQRVLILAEELNLNYEFKDTNEEKDKQFLEKSPFGKVPIIEYGDRILYESRTILRYISKANKEIEDFYGNIIVDMWLEIESQNFDPYASKLIYEKKNEQNSNEKTDKENVNVLKCIEKLEKTLDIYNQTLSEQDYICGDKMTIADISHIPYAYLLLKHGYKDIFKKRPNVYNWLKRIMKREAVKRIYDKTE